MRLTRSLSAGLIAALSLAPMVVRAQGPQSKGWVGIVITTGIGQTDRNGSMVFSDYPIIESVEPGSPAERAGLMTGDLILSINSQDLRRNPIPTSALLEPGQKVLIKYKRNDTSKSITFTIEPRPAGNPQTVALSVIGPAPGPERRLAGSSQQVTIKRAAAPVVEISPLAIPSATPSIGIAGALLTQLNDDLRAALSVKGSGVFVINVQVGTPAGEAGLKSGDVILKADRESIENPGELLRVMRAATENSVRLELVRRRQPRVIMLRW
ncbi:MAG TPA: PDZ domain-containing protein [Gemmatimonadaceae bacterium]|nr:PDZ domain-containing protein [Gemmatimonadaceae bacterium]